MDKEQDVRARLGKVERQLSHLKTLLILLLVVVIVRPLDGVNELVALALRGLVLIVPICALAYAGFLLLDCIFLRSSREKRDQGIIETMQEEIDACRSAHADSAGPSLPIE